MNHMKIEEHGFWFLPGNLEKQLFGKLTFSLNEHPQLSLSGQLEKLTPEQKLDGVKFDIINGYLTSDKKVTLLNCYQKGKYKTGIQTSEITAQYLLIGYHFKSPDEISLQGVSVKYKNFESWIDKPGFEIAWSTNQENTSVKEINVKKTIPDPITLGSLLGFSLILVDKTVNLQQLQLEAVFQGKPEKIILEDKKALVIKSEEKKSLDEIIEVIYLFQDLLVFASGQITYPYEVNSYMVVKEQEFTLPKDVEYDLMRGVIEPDKTTISDSGIEIQQFDDQIKITEEEKEKPIRLSIYFKASRLDNLELKFDSRSVLFEFRDIEAHLEKILELWEEHSQKLEPIIDLYLRLIYIPEHHINSYFLNLAQAIEAFHNRSYSGRYLPKSVYKHYVRKPLEEAIKLIPCFTDADSEHKQIDLRKYKKILKEEKLSHLNSYSLRDRLEEIIKEHIDCLPDHFFISSEDRDKFLKQLRKTRNYLTHLSDNKNDVAEGKELRRLCIRLKVVLEVCLLKKLGLEETQIKKIISRNR